MKKLNKIRLINWHFFSNETIEIHNNVLLSGENASGKSTILDAIQYVLTAGDQYFNMAANEKGKRDLRGYVKCKIGSEDREYLRPGDVSGHIALEFYDELKKTYFVAGAIIDVIGEGRPRNAFYIKEGKIEERLFADDNGIIHSITSFKKSNKDIEVFNTNKEAKNKFRYKFGSINERYFNLIPKALAFKPISNVKDFIYEHLLEEKQIEVESIQESIRAYKDLEQTLRVIKEKIDDLREIQNKYSEISQFENKTKLYEYVIRSIDLLKNEEQIIKQKQEIERLKSSSEQKQTVISDIEKQIETLDQRSKDIYSKLQKNKDFQDSEIYDRQIQTLKKDINYQIDKNNQFKNRKEQIEEIAKDLKNKTNEKIYDELAKINKMLITDENIDKAKDFIIDLDTKLKDYSQDLLNRKAYLSIQKQDITKEIQDVSSIMRKLENRRLSYNEMLLYIKEEIETGLKNIYNKDISVHILSELLEITDPTWHNTIEDFLGAQRFNLIVDPRYYDDALKIYDNLKRTKRIYGYGLVNTKKILQYTTCDKRSLASIITSENEDAKHYINYYCGNLIMVDNVMDLDKYSQAITKEGMLYRGYIVRPLNDNTEKPFIGKNAVDNQRRKYNKVGLDLREKFVSCEQQLDLITMQLNDLNSLSLKDLVNDLDIEATIDRLNKQLKDLIVKKQDLMNKGYEVLYQEYLNLKQEIDDLNNKKNDVNQEIGSIKNSIDNKNEDILKLQDNEQLIKKELDLVLENNYNILEEANNILNNKELSKDRLQIQYKELLLRDRNSLQNIIDGLRNLQSRYEIKYHTGYGLGLENYQNYLSELDKLEKSELIKYESKVRQARDNAELVFKEDFLSKLRDYIITAQEEINQINDALKDIKFGKDSYRFVFPKSEEYSGIYDMVLNNNLFDTGSTIFTFEFQQKYQQELERLFDEISKDELNSKNAINKFMDYRTYMDYDIEIINENQVSKYSKVFKEKSGGETQVPFYVAVIASFVQIYNQATKNPNNDAVCLILFDEVFDKMDNKRVRSMMQFIDELPVQVIIATPPQKIELLSKFTDTTVIVYRNNYKVKTEQAIKLLRE